MLNCVGLQTPGIESFIEHDLPWLLTKDVAVIANFFGTSIENYCQAAEAFANTGVHMLEMNISCPNVHDGGVAFGVKPESVYEITKAVKSVSKQPLIVKLTPNVSDITENALAAQEAGADAISLINTLTGIAVDVHRRKMILSNKRLSPYVHSYFSRRGIPLYQLKRILLTLWLTLGAGMAIFHTRWAVVAILASVGVGVTIHLYLKREKH